MLGNYNEEKQPLILDAQGSYNMLQVARWGKFLAVAGMVFMGLMVLFVIAMSFFMFSTMGRADAAGEAMAAGFTIGYGFVMLIMLAIYIYPVYALYKFSVLSKFAINTKDQQSFNNALKHLKGLFMYTGILTLVIICMYALTFIFMLAIGGFAAMAQ